MFQRNGASCDANQIYQTNAHLVCIEMATTETSGSMGSKSPTTSKAKSASQGALQLQVVLCNMHETNLHPFVVVGSLSWSRPICDNNLA
jgi:hypothetical protein